MNIFTNKFNLSFLSALLLGLSFQPFNLGFLAWFALVPFIIILFHSSLLEGLFFGFLTGLLSNTFTLYWLSANIGTTFSLGLISLFAAVIYLSIFWSLFSFLFCFINNNTGKGIYFFPFGWVIFEYFFSIGIMGFPWMSLATTQTNYLPVIQIVEFTGIFGISFWIATLNIIIFKIFKSQNINKMKYFNFFLFLLVSIWILGYIRLYTINENKSNFLEILIVQPNINPNEKWDKNKKEKIFNDLVDLSKKNLKNSTDLIIWPEVATPYYIFKNHSKLRRIKTNLLNKNQSLLTGSLDWEKNDNIFKNYNSVGLINQDIKITTYKKIRLVPFGEYIPFLIPFLENLNLGQYSSGEKVTNFKINNFNFISKICFESIYPIILRNSTDFNSINYPNPNFLVIVVNDGWFGNSAGPYQHFEISKLRAVENRFPVIRSANSGISAVINLKGEVIDKISINKKGFLLNKIFPSKTKTFFSKYGNWLVYLSLSFNFYLILLIMKKKLK